MPDEISRRLGVETGYGEGVEAERARWAKRMRLLVDDFRWHRNAQAAINLEEVIAEMEAG